MTKMVSINILTELNERDFSRRLIFENLLTEAWADFYRRKRFMVKTSEIKLQSNLDISPYSGHGKFRRYIEAGSISSVL